MGGSSSVGVHTPIPNGPYTVGFVDLMCDQPDLKEKVFVRIHYPADLTDIKSRQSEWPLWIPSGEYAQGYVDFAKLKPAFLFKKLFSMMDGGSLKVPCLPRVPLSTSAAAVTAQVPCLDTQDGLSKFPVAVFSHGLGGMRATYSSFCVELCSRGYVVASLEHQDGSASMTCHVASERTKSSGKSGSAVSCDRNGNQLDWKPYHHCEDKTKNLTYEFRNPMLRKRIQEVSTVADLLWKLNDGDPVINSLPVEFDFSQFKGRMDLNQLVMTGHSFGGATAVGTLAVDKRFKLGLCHDAWMVPVHEEVYSQVEQPLCFLNSGDFQWASNISNTQRMESASVEFSAYTVKGTCHSSLSDVAFMAGPKVGKMMHFRGALDPSLAMDVFNNISLAFIERHLFESANDNLKKTVDNHTEHVVDGFILPQAKH